MSHRPTIRVTALLLAADSLDMVAQTWTYAEPYAYIPEHALGRFVRCLFRGLGITPA